MDLKQKLKKYKENNHNLKNNIVRIIDNKILPKRLSTSLVLLLFGAFFYYRFMSDKNIGGGWALIITAVIYFSLGIGLYGLFTWLVMKFFQMFAYLFRVIFRGQVQITVNKDKISSKLVYK